ncbi:MAG: hypothetical protein SH856_06975 [Flavobacteriales bacterium]|nr:hypothetical protein [Flavobacteriales bacterium]
MRKIFAAYSLLLLFSSCWKNEPREVVVAGIMEEGVAMDTLQLLSFPFSTSSTLNESYAMITDDENNIYPFFYSNGYLINITSSLVPESGKAYDLKVFSGSDILESTAIIPPGIDFNSLNTDTFTVDPDNPNEAAFFLNWNDVAGHSFILKLENLEENPSPLPYAESGLFETYYGLPVLGSNAIMVANFFSHYGHHRLTVYCIDRQYEEIFFYSPSDFRNLVTEGPTNIQGGKGFFTGVSSFIVDLYVNP